MAGTFLVEGQRAIHQIISSSPDTILEILHSGEPEDIYRQYPLRQITHSQLKSISSTQTPQETIAVVQLPADTYSPGLPAVTGNKILLLEDVQDPGNVGTLIRTASAFGYTGIILTDKCADPFSPKCIQSTAGTVLSLWIRRTPRYAELAAALKSSGYIFVAMDVRGEEDISVLQCRHKLVLALGNEAAGLSTGMLELADHKIRIPVIAAKAESLNVAMCGVICMYLSYTC